MVSGLRDFRDGTPFLSTPYQLRSIKVDALRLFQKTELNRND